MSNNNNNNKILPLDQHRDKNNQKPATMDRLSYQLLQHMRQVRRDVPVNYQLQAELRQKLLQRQAQINAEDGAGAVYKLAVNRRYLLIPAVVGLMLLLVAMISVWQQTLGANLQPVGTAQQLFWFWNTGDQTSFTVAAQNRHILVSRQGELIWSTGDAGDDQNIAPLYRQITLAPDWRYYDPVFSPDGSKVALIRQQAGQWQIVLTAVAELISDKADVTATAVPDFEILATSTQAGQWTDLDWSPDGTALVYTAIDQQQTAQVWLLEKDSPPRVLTGGRQPTWSPDGTKLIVQRDAADIGKLYLITLADGQEVLLGQGIQPYWNNNGYLAFISTRVQERVLTFMPDGSPQFSVQQRVGEIRVVATGDNGQGLLQDLENQNWLALSNLLVTPDWQVRDVEIEWLRQLELQAVRQPRVLLLDQIERCQSPVLSSDEDELFYMRQDGAITTILHLELEKRF